MNRDFARAAQDGASHCGPSREDRAAALAEADANGIRLLAPQPLMSTVSPSSRKVPVHIDPEHHAWMIGRAARQYQRGTVEAKFRKVQFVDKGIYDPDRIVLSNVVIDAFGK
ncbi:hypothetical protein GCM10011400_72510 [Paraburkholderia caffeinilytica]|uniref:Uncharacterized protein n=1 Tax=Paraburkholderia caffeinilytica TaxID=1761016 RepID=A0ABQ1NGQ7_9BURK|nr:hypothetical protein GCM10011400_72510 [Paraburkholderia caffeinilytica]